MEYGNMEYFFFFFAEISSIVKYQASLIPLNIFALSIISRAANFSSADYHHIWMIGYLAYRLDHPAH